MLNAGGAVPGEREHVNDVHVLLHHVYRYANTGLVGPHNKTIPRGTCEH
jgi:hypothetical protein